MARLAEERKEIDLLTLREELSRDAQLEQVGGTAYIASLVDGIPDIANVERYAHIVADKARLRALVVEGNAIMRAALDHDADADAIVADAMAALGPQATKQDHQAVPLHEALGRAHSRQEELARSGGSIALLCGIFPTLDKLKFFGRTLVAIEAPSKHAKSGMMVELANGFADQGYAAAMFSLEDNEHEISLRHSSARTGIAHSSMRDWADWREYHADYYTKVAECRSDASRKTIFLADGLHSVEAITLEMRRLKAMHSIDAVLIDYVQEIETRQRIQNREERLAEICRVLRKTAVELGVCCVVLSQIDEVGWEKRGYGPLHMSDFAHAKLIGKIARGTLAFHRPRKVKPDDSHPICFALMQVIANNNERTHDGFEGHFDEVTQQWGEGDCEANNCRTLRDGPVQQKLSA
jgi:replicative DNA helicase